MLYLPQRYSVLSGYNAVFFWRINMLVQKLLFASVNNLDAMVVVVIVSAVIAVAIVGIGAIVHYKKASKK